MSKTSYDELEFEDQNFAEQHLPQGKYSDCIFKNCSLVGVDLSLFAFVDCQFQGCLFSTTKLDQTAFREVKFVDCKLLGLHFEDCNDFLFAVTFENCDLSMSSFFQGKLKGTKFQHCNLYEVDFSEADLNEAIFDHSDLQRAIFKQSNLEKADFRKARNYHLNPELNRIKKAKFSAPEVLGLLQHYDILIE
jgi:fluoroquinolone resistance protein